MPQQRLPTKRAICRSVEQILTDCLPPGWTLLASSDHAQIDLLAELASPRGETAVLVVAVERRLEPRNAGSVAERISACLPDPSSVPVVASSYLSPRSRGILEGLGVGYVDTTGNARLASSDPGVFISVPGADRDPWPQDGTLQSLRGRGASRAMRAVIDTTPPFGVRSLAGLCDVAAPTLSRVLALLTRDGIVGRSPRDGSVLSVDWEAAIRRWAVDYDQIDSNTATTCLEPRGISTLERNLVSSGIKYAATGAFAAQRFHPIAPAGTATLYVDDAREATERLGLRETDAGANVVLLEPFDSVVFDRTAVLGGLRCVAVGQLAVDLLTGPGREPSQGEALLGWMQANRAD